MQTHSKPGCLLEISQHKTILLLAPKSVKTDLVSIENAYAQRGHCTEVLFYETPPKKDEIINELGVDIDAVLMFCPPRRAPSTLVDGPFLELAQKRIPIGLLPLQKKDTIVSFSATMQAVDAKKKDLVSVALLAQKFPRYSHLVDRMKIGIPKDIASFRWTSHELTRENMIKGLGLGLGLSIYFGHGRPTGWVGYYGLRAHHFTTDSSQSLGAMLNLCCNTASRRKVACSFAEKMVLQGIASASLGAVRPTLHRDNMRWAVGLCKALEEGAQTLDELLLRAVPLNHTALEHYRIIGDPLASICTSFESVTLANNMTNTF